MTSRPTVDGVSDVSPAFETQVLSTTPHYLGHRDRLRDRFLAGAETLPDYELLELVLYAALPRRDVKPLAKQLLAIFGSLPMSSPHRASACWRSGA